MNEGLTRYGLQVSTLQENIQIESDSISGNLKKVESYPEFGGEESTQPGHYLALDFTIPEGATVTTKVEGGTSDKWVNLNTDKYCVYRIKTPSTQKILVKTAKGSKEVEKSYSLTKLTLGE